jgi:hypothetical protein
LYDLDAELQALGPYRVTVVELDPSKARLRTQTGVGDACFAQDQLRVPLRLRIRSADDALDVTTDAWAVGTRWKTWFDAELDPDEADLDGDLPDAVDALVDAQTAENRDLCDDELIPRVRVNYGGELDEPRTLSFDVEYDAKCLRSDHAIGAVTLAAPPAESR